MFKFRIVSFTILLAVLGAIIFWQPYGGVILLAVAPLIAWQFGREFTTLVSRNGLPSYPKLTAWGIAIYTLVYGTVFFVTSRQFISLVVKLPDWLLKVLDALPFVVSFLLPLMILFSWLIMMLTRKEETRKELLLKLLGSWGCGVFIWLIIESLLNVYYWNVGIFLWLVLTTKAMDTGGYIFGMLSGKFLPGGNHKIAPHLSPKKSWEGLIGGLILSVLVSWLIIRLLGGEQGVEAAGFWIYILAVMLGFGSFLGDLTESALKRACNIKDSGAVIPGMGGVFDVLDSFIYNAPVAAVLLNLLIN